MQIVLIYGRYKSKNANKQSKHHNLITGSIKGQQSCPNSHFLPTGYLCS